MSNGGIHWRGAASDRCPGAFHKSSAGKRQAAPSKGMDSQLV